MPPTPLIIVNPRASRLHDPDQRQEIVTGVVRAVAARTGLDAHVEEGSLEDAQAALVGSIGAPLVVAVGGDGTIRQAAAALAGTKTPIAVVPGGTGNVLAGSLGIGGLGPATDAIRHGVVRTMDLGEARWGATDVTDASGAADDRTESSVFLVACGMGLDARIMAAAEHEWKRRMRFGAYIGAAVRELGRLQSAAFHIVADDATIDMRGYLVLVANAGELVPGKVGPRRSIDPADGLLDLIVVGGDNPLQGLHGAARLMLADGDLHDAVVRRQVRNVRIEADPAQPIEIDGDHHPPAWLEAHVLPGALTIVGRVR